MCTETKELNIKKIDMILLEIKKMYVRAKDALDIYEAIRNSAQTINSSPAGIRFWVPVQRMAVESMNLNICKIFDRSEIMGHEQNSFDNVLKLIEVSYFDREIYTVFNESYLKFKIEKEGAFKKLINARHNIIAHSKHESSITSTASMGDMDEILKFVFEFSNQLSERICNAEFSFDDLQLTKCVNGILDRLYSK